MSISSLREVVSSYTSNVQPKQVFDVLQAVARLDNLSTFQVEKVTRKCVKLCRKERNEIDAYKNKVLLNIDALEKKKENSLSISHILPFCDEVRYNALVDIKGKARAQQNEFPKAVVNTKLFLQKVLKQEYGVTLIHKLLDETKSFMMHREAFLRILLVDKLLQNKDPVAAFEWFDHLSREEVLELRKEIHTFKKKMQSEFALSDQVVFYLAACSKTQVPENLLKMLNRAVGRSKLTNDNLVHLQDYFQPFYAPSDTLLFSLVRSCVVQKQLVEAEKIALAIADPEVKAKAYAEILLGYKKTNFDSAHDYFSKIKKELSSQELCCIIIEYCRVSRNEITGSSIERLVVTNWMKALSEVDRIICFEQVVANIMNTKNNPRGAVELCYKWIYEARDVLEGSLAASIETVAFYNIVHNQDMKNYYPELSLEQKCRVLSNYLTIYLQSVECRSIASKCAEFSMKVSTEKERSTIYKCGIIRFMEKNQMSHDDVKTMLASIQDHEIRIEVKRMMAMHPKSSGSSIIDLVSLLSLANH